MGQKYISGSQTNILYAFEDADAFDQTVGNHTASDQTYEPFGKGVTLDINADNTIEEIGGVGQRNTEEIVNLGFKGTITANGNLTSPYWLLGVLGANTDGGTSGAYTHTYTEADILPSATIKVSSELGTNDSLRTLFGCIFDRCNLEVATGQVVKFTLEGMYRYESSAGSGLLTNSVDPNLAFTFAGGTIELPDGTTVGGVQNARLSISNNTTMEEEVGSRFAADRVSKNRRYEIQMTAIFNDRTKLLSYFYDGTGSGAAPTAGNGVDTTVTLTFTNNATNPESVVVTLTGVRIGQESISHDGTDTTKEQITAVAKACTSIVYTNNEQTAPAQATNIT